MERWSILPIILPALKTCISTKVSGPRCVCFRRPVSSSLRFMLREETQYDLIHGNFWMSGWVASQLRQRLHIPAVQIFHATGRTKRRHQKKVDSSPGDRIKTEMDVIRNVDRLIAQCPAERAELVDDYHADPARVVIIPSAVNTQVFRPVPRDEARRRIGLDEAGKVIVYIGRMLPRKDIRNVVRALALLFQQDDGSLDSPASSLKFMVVGGETVEPDPVATPEIGELQRLAGELGVLGHIRFVGKRQSNEIRDYYSAGDVEVTTPWYEPFGLTPLEAMACARPVIGSAVGGITFTIKDGETGLLVPARDPAALAASCSLKRAAPADGTGGSQARRARIHLANCGHAYRRPLRVGHGRAGEQFGEMARGDRGTAAGLPADNSRGQTLGGFCGTCRCTHSNLRTQDRAGGCPDKFAWSDLQRF
jgi:D-inositol-3-phosphate glycosyltransferase